MVKLNPFTPRSGEAPKVFLNRNEEKEFFQKRIKEALAGRFNHYIILGDWGIGKTVLMMCLKSIAQEENSLCSFFAAEQFKAHTKHHHLSLHLLQSIAKNLPFELKERSNFIKKITGFGIQIVGTGFNLNFNPPKDSFIDPQILLREGLISLWEDLKTHTNLVTVLIDDVQNYKEVSEIFITIKNVLSSEEILKKTRFLFVLSSTPDGWEQFLIKHHPIGRYFIPARTLNLFSREDTKNLVKKTLKGTNVDFSDYAMEKISESTRGHLFEIHALGLALYNAQVKGFVDKNEWLIGFKKGLNYLGDTVFNNKIKLPSENEKEILYVLSLFENIASLENISKMAAELKIGVKNIRDGLRRLVEKKLIIKPRRGHYFIGDKLFREYIKLKLK